MQKELIEQIRVTRFHLDTRSCDSVPNTQQILENQIVIMKALLDIKKEIDTKPSRPSMNFGPG
jgi:hypothetical protein